MPIKPAPRNISETEYMLRLLRCVDALDCVTDLQLWTFVAELELMDYVTMRLCLHKLLAAGEVQYGAGSLKNHLYLTEKGRQALKLFGERLPGEIAEKIAGATGAFRERITSSQQIRAAYEIAKRNEYRLNLSVLEGDLTMMTIRIQTKSRRLAGRAIRQFEAQASKVLLYLFQLAQGAQSTQTLAGAPQGEIVRHSPTEFEARHSLAGRRVQFDIALTLPSEEAAAAYLNLFTDSTVAYDTAEQLCKIICGLHF
jgi:hypothetical protein